MFKRRKPDEESTMGDAVIRQSQDPAAGADTGLGVPPFRPSPQMPSSGSQPGNKEFQMGRPPFSNPLGPTPGAAQNGAAQNGAGLSGAVPGNPPIPTASQARPTGPTAMPRPTGSIRDNAAPERRTLVVGRGISVQGMVQDAERLVVEGQVEATMIHAAELAVSPGGLFKGEVEVEDAEVAGTVDGTITARGNLIVRATGVVLGTARCRRLQVEDGGQITGRIEMINEPRAARQVEPARAVAMPAEV